MARVIGIDPGTVSFDVCGLDDGRPFLHVSMSSDAARNPSPLVEQLVAARPIDLIAAPSGYGLPLVPLDQVTDQQLDLFILVRREDRGDREAVGALRQLVHLIREARLPAVFLPGVVHLPTVPSHRKVNRIDMGTADKVCVAALGIWDQARRRAIHPARTAFILLELGGAFTAGVAVRDGQIVDGIGGTGGGLGFRALGTLDGELAYVLGRVSKSLLFSGGASYVAGDPQLTPDEWAARAESDPSVRRSWLAFLESAEKMVAALRVSSPEPYEILLSGRLSAVGGVIRALGERLARVAPVRRITGLDAEGKEAAQGAAILADGLAGGRNRELAETLQLSGARGTVLDHLYVAGGERIRRDFGVP
jgi:predicted butyrate kinase (DUF1464 family)